MLPGHRVLSPNHIHVHSSHLPLEQKKEGDRQWRRRKKERKKTVRKVKRNKFVKGDIVEILSPEITGESFTVDVLFNEAGEEIDGCPHPGMICKVKVPFELEKNSFIRKALV